MAYRIAIASADGIHVDTHFGNSDSFTIVEVDDDGSYIFNEKRLVNEGVVEKSGETQKACIDQQNCKKSGGGCGGGHSDSTIESRVSLISDCRCLLCDRIGPGAERQLEKKAITTFQISIKIEDALQKIIDYYVKIDNHISLRKIKK